LLQRQQHASPFDHVRPPVGRRGASLAGERHLAKARGARIVIPRPGEHVDVDASPAVDGWWEALL
ncbi:hypothetical protein AB0B89_36465, partial [Sphaerisporangium sp. NPDC049002]|uniref:hypothetical protein n=1 Tax=Sphaerisporangium sp. NPDC049002 TaxID=3155392 RepID=UPI0033C270B9